MKTQSVLVISPVSCHKSHSDISKVTSHTQQRDTSAALPLLMCRSQQDLSEGCKERAKKCNQSAGATSEVLLGIAAVWHWFPELLIHVPVLHFVHTYLKSCCDEASPTLEEQLPSLEVEALCRVSGALRDGGAGLGSRRTDHSDHLDPWWGFCSSAALRDGSPLI